MPIGYLDPAGTQFSPPPKHSSTYVEAAALRHFFPFATPSYFDHACDASVATLRRASCSTSAPNKVSIRLDLILPAWPRQRALKAPPSSTIPQSPVHSPQLTTLRRPGRAPINNEVRFYLPRTSSGHLGWSSGLWSDLWSAKDIYCPFQGRQTSTCCNDLRCCNTPSFSLTPTKASPSNNHPSSVPTSVAELAPDFLHLVSDELLLVAAVRKSLSPFCVFPGGSRQPLLRRSNGSRRLDRPRRGRRR